MLIVMGVTFYTSRTILKVLGVSDYGVYNVVGGIVNMMAFLNGALSGSTSRFLTYELGNGNTENLKKTFSASLNLHIGVALLVLIIGETIGLWFFYEKIVIPPERISAAFWVFQFSIVTTMINFTQVPYNAALIAHENMSIYAYVGLYEAISKLIIVYLLYISPIDKLIFYGLLLMLNCIIIQLFYRYYTIKKYEECRFRKITDKNLYTTLIGYSGWDLVGSFAFICQGEGLNILLNIFFGPVINAARAIAMQIQSVLALFINNIMMAVRPQVIKSYATKNYNNMYQLTFQTAKYSYLLILMMAIPICFNMNFILHFWLGENVPLYTNIFTITIVITYVIQTFYTACLMPYHAIGKIKIGSIIGGIIMFSSLPINYILFKLNYPAYFAFITLFVTSLMLNSFLWWLVHKYVWFPKKKLISESILPCALITIVTCLASLFLHFNISEGWSKLILMILLNIILIPLLTYKIALKQDERQRLLTLIKSKICKYSSN